MAVIFAGSGLRKRKKRGRRHDLPTAAVRISVRKSNNIGIAGVHSEIMKKKSGKRKIYQFLTGMLVLVCVICFCTPVCAGSRKVRVAFFPMNGFHIYSETDGYGGMDVAYLEELRVYTGWDIEYVMCESWNEALLKLEAKEVDLVGSAQYSEERAETFEFASLSSGYTYGCLFVEKDSSMDFEDFDRMRDMTFGVVESYVRKPEFFEYLDRNGIAQPKLMEFGTTQELQAALKSGEIDVAAHTLTEVEEGQCLVGKFAYAPYYYMTWKGNEQLIAEMNIGIEELYMDNPTLEQELISAYYENRWENFAAEEQQYIDRGVPVRIGFYKDTKPLSYINEQGEYDGIYIQILKAIAARSGIAVELCPLDRGDYWKELLAAGDIDFQEGANNMQLARDENIRLTSSFMHYNAIIISKSDYVRMNQGTSLVLTKGRTYWAESMKQNGVSGKVIYCDSAKDCLYTVGRGEADITVLNTIEYNYLSKNERFSDLIEWDNYRYQSGSTLAASKEVDPILFDVINKSLRLISEAEKEDIINQYMNISYTDYNLTDYLYMNKDVIMIAGTVLILFIASALVVSHTRRKSYQILEQKNGELQIAIKEAKKANMAKTEFLSHMSHDIRTPINGIMGMLNIAEKNPDDPEKQKDCRQKIKTSAEHLLSLINDVLDINKLESGNVEVKKEPFSLPQLFTNCATIVGGQAASKKIELTTEFEEGQFSHTDFIGSPLHIKQVLINIAGNAIKYNRPEGSVHMSCRELSAQDGVARICFTVSDTGIGMSKEYMEHIFEPFTQELSGMSARTTYQGTGLGMTITKKLIDNMGGTIEIESEPEKGSVFTVVLPLEIDAQAEEEKEISESEQVEIAGKQALLVEDNELNQEIAQFILEDFGLRVTVANNGQEAVEFFEQAEPETYQIIFMDVMMPVMNGYEAAKAIRAMDRPDAAKIPIITMTANAFAEDVQAAKDAGMNEHIAKPLEIDVIARVLAQWLGE